MDTLASLGDKVDTQQFKQLREEMENFKHDLKAETQVLRNTVSELEKAADMSSSKIESLEASNTSLSLALASQAKEVDTLRAQLKGTLSRTRMRQLFESQLEKFSLTFSSLKC